MRRLLLFLALILVILITGVAIAASILNSRRLEPFKGYEAAEQFIEIPAGSSVSDIGRRLVEAGVVRDPYIFRVVHWQSGSSSLKAGEYRFSEPVNVETVVDRLARGDVYSRRITFPEGLTIPEMARVYETRGFGSAADFLRAARQSSIVVDLDPSTLDLEGYLFPETYALPRGTPASKLVELMVKRFRAVYEEGLRKQAEDQGLTTRQVVTLAALIEKETGHEAERPLVAAVYRNRLKIGMAMQADPTVIYALQKAGRYDGNLRRVDLEFDSRYNTYKYPGLPPGPIASPGKAALVAALNPADVRHLYFVSRNDGTHVFADTLSQHSANVRRYQVEFFQQGARGR